MKNIAKTTSKFVALLIALIAVSVLPGCNDNPDEYITTDGFPKVNFVRIPDAASADSMVTHAFMGTTIALVGENLTSIREIFFNDCKAILNNSLITSNALIIPIPTAIPNIISNKIYMINGSGDTTIFRFVVDFPAPIVSNLSCEYVADGDIATINGNYFKLPGGGEPIVTFTPNLTAKIVSYSLYEIKVIVPTGSQFGHVSVKSKYGSTRSGFYFRDNRGMILDWDNTNASGGWRSGKTKSTDPEGISGNYVYFTGDIPDVISSWWNEDPFSFDLWGPANGRPQGELFTSEPAKSVLKFEVNIPQAWTIGALQMIFTPWSTTGTNSYIGDVTVPRGFWEPWKKTGSYITDGWITVAFPLTDFRYNADGADIGMGKAGNFGGLTFFIFKGSILTGTACTPLICIDNIRVVPAE